MNVLAERFVKPKLKQFFSKRDILLKRCLIVNLDFKSLFNIQANESDSESKVQKIQKYLLQNAKTVFLWALQDIWE